MIPLLILLVPVLAAISIFFSGRSISASRLLVAGTIIAQLLLVVGAFVLFPSEDAQRIAGQKSMWTPVEHLVVSLGTLDAGSFSYRLSLHFGIDGLALPFLLLTIMAFCGAVAMLWGNPAFRPFHYSLLLLFDACITGVLVSHEGLQLLLCFGGALFTVVVFAGTSQGGRGIAAARRFLPVAFGAAMVLGLALTSLASRTERTAPDETGGSRTFELPVLADQAARDYRANLSLEEEPGGMEQTDPFRRLLFILLLCACGALMMIFPFHPLAGDVIDSSSPAMSSLLLTLLPLVGFYLLIRFPLVLFPEFGTDPFWRGLIVGAGCVTSIYASIVALGERKPIRALRYITVAWSGLALALLPFLEKAWVGAATSGFFLCGVCTIALAGLIGGINRRVGEEHAEEMRGLRRIVPRWSLFVGLGAMILSVLPLFIGGMIFRNAVTPDVRPEVSGLPALWGGWILLALIGGMLVGLPAARMGWRLLSGEYPVSLKSAVPSDLSRRTLYGGAVVAILIGILAVVAVTSLHKISGELIESIIERREAVQT